MPLKQTSNILKGHLTFKKITSEFLQMVSSTGKTPFAPAVSHYNFQVAMRLKSITGAQHLTAGMLGSLI